MQDENKDKLNANEVRIIQMALQQVIEDLEATSKDVTLPFTPEARSISRDMIATAKSASKKLELHTNIKADMAPYKEGDEDEFLTKES